MGTRTEVLKCFYSATRWSIPSQVRKVRGFRVWRSRKEITDTWNFKHAVQIDGWRFRLDDVESLYGKLLVLNGCYIWYVHIIYIYSLLCLPGPEIEVVILGDLVTCFALKSPSLERENPGTTLMSLWWIVHRWWWSKFWDWGNLSKMAHKIQEFSFEVVDEDDFIHLENLTCHFFKMGFFKSSGGV